MVIIGLDVVVVTGFGTARVVVTGLGVARVVTGFRVVVVLGGKYSFCGVVLVGARVVVVGLTVVVETGFGTARVVVMGVARDGVARVVLTS